MAAKNRARWRTSRREFIKQTAAASVLLLARCGTDEGVCSQAAPPLAPPADWTVQARVAGLETFSGMNNCSIERGLDALASDMVNVVEIDGELSNYLGEGQFEAQLELINRISEAAHHRGMRTVAYYPTLEVLTSDADKVPGTMFHDHPDWTQIYFDGRPAVFIGNVVFWVEPGTESCWMCPNTGYTDYFVDRVKRLAGTAVDGLWGDVPLFADLAVVYPCLCPSCKARFLAETGHPIPSSLNWDDPVFRRWCVWRHGLISEFEQRVHAGAKQARADFEVLIETVSMDYSSATLQALDGAATDSKEVLRIWEVDCVSDTTAMRDASASDWQSMAIMMKHGRGCAWGKPSWVFCYGLEEDDAERVMGLAIASGNNPYETKIPLMNRTVGNAYRRRLFGWLSRHPEVFSSQPHHTVALLYSSPSRDFVDRSSGDGLYDSMNETDPQWWSDDGRELAHFLGYLPDYRGMAQMLIQEHIPFDVRIVPHLSKGSLANYRLVCAPSFAACSTALTDVLQDYVGAGGHLLLTGPALGEYDTEGNTRKDALLLQRFGLDDGQPGVWQQKPVGKGYVLYEASRLGREFFTGQHASLRTDLMSKLASIPWQIETDAPPAVFMDLRRSEAPERLHIFCANLVGLGVDKKKLFAPRDTSFELAVALDGKRAKRVTLSTPLAGKDKQDTEATFTEGGGRVRFKLALGSVAMATIELE